jgi:hypothetical protein
LLIQTRLYWGLFPAFTVLAALGFWALRRLRLPGVRLERLAGALVVLSLGLTVFRASVSLLETGALPAMLDEQARETYVFRELGWYVPATQSVNEAQGRTLLLWEPRSFYCLPKCDPDETLDRWLDDLRSLGDPDSVAHAWRAQGFTHILYYRLGADFIRTSDARYTPEDWRALDALLDSLIVEQTFGDAYVLYALGPEL